MKRREIFVGTLFSGAYVASQSLGAPTAVASQKTASFLGSTGHSPHAVVVADNTIYALARAIPEWEFFASAHSAVGSGQPLWQYRLPRAMYLSVGIHSDGSLLLHAIGFLNTQSHHLLKLNSHTGELNVLTEVPPGRALHYAGTGIMVRISESGDLEALNSADERPHLRHITELDSSFRGMVHIELFAGTTSLAIADPRTGAVIRVDLSLGTVETVSITAPEMASSLAFYEPIERNHPPGEPPLQPQIVTAIGANGPRRITMLLSPYKNDGTANLLSLGDLGNDATPTQIVLPHRTTVGNPFKLGRIGDQLAVLFSRGSYALYAT